MTVDEGSPWWDKIPPPEERDGDFHFAHWSGEQYMEHASTDDPPSEEMRTAMLRSVIDGLTRPVEIVRPQRRPWWRRLLNRSKH